MHPSDFMNEYVIPAMNSWKADQRSKHLATHALSQIDILAEVVANCIGKKAASYRNELGKKYPALAKIREAHNCHKHGQRKWSSEFFISKGQRPDEAVGHGIFIGVTHIGGSLTRYKYLALTLDDDSKERVYTLIEDGMKALEQEMRTLGI